MRPPGPLVTDHPLVVLVRVAEEATGARSLRTCGIADGGLGSRLVGGGGGAVDAVDRARAVAEVAEAGLCGIRSPSAAAFVGEVIVRDLLGGDDEDLLLRGCALKQALVYKGVIARGLAGV